MSVTCREVSQVRQGRERHTWSEGSHPSKAPHGTREMSLPEACEPGEACVDARERHEKVTVKKHVRHMSDVSDRQATDRRERHST